MVGEPCLSRETARDEKMLADFTLKLPLSTRREFTAIADSEDMSASEYVRDLIEKDIAARKKKFKALIPIFLEAALSDQKGLGET